MLNRLLSYHWRFILIGIGLIVFSSFFKLFYQNENWSVEHQVNHFEEEVNNVDNLLLNEIEHYYSIVDSGGLESLLKKGVDYHKHLEEEGIGVYIYSGENLKFWSTSKLVIPDFNIKEGLVQTDNGFYLRRFKGYNDFVFIAQFFVKRSFVFENSYVQNSFDTKLYLNEGWDISLTALPSSKNVVLKSLNQSFYLLPNVNFKQPHYYYLIIFEILGLLFYFLGTLLLSKQLSLKRKLVLVPVLLLGLRLLLWYYKWPVNLNALEIFDSRLLAFSEFIPSLGDLLLHSVFGLVFIFTILKDSNFYHSSFNDFRIVVFVIAITIIFLITWTIVETVEGVVLFSEIPLDLTHILSIDYTSVVALFCIACILASYIVIIWKVVGFFKQLGFLLNKLLIWFLGCVVLIFLVAELWDGADSYEILWSLPVFSLLAYTYFENDKTIPFSISISILFLFSLMITQSLRDYSEEKTIEEKKILLNKLGKEKDLVAEYLYGDVYQKILKDKKALNILEDYSLSEQDIFKYFRTEFFKGFWDKFDLQVNPCFEGDSIFLLNKEKSVSCRSFFEDIIKLNGSEVADNFFHIENLNGRISYIGVVEFEEGKRVYLELDSKFKPDGVGFPTLLLDEQVERKSLNPEYGFAHFKTGELVKQKGGVLYSTDLSYYGYDLEDEWGYFEKDGIGHLVKRNGDDVYFLSEKITSTWDQMAFYSYLFAFFSILTIPGVFLYRLAYGLRNESSSFKTRFQSIIIFILFFSTVFIGVGSVYYLKNQYNQKNFDAISEKIKSVQIEVEHKFGEFESIEKADAIYVQQILQKFSRVFFTDINLYDPNGALVSSSQNEVFKKGLVGNQMDPLAMYQMLFNAKSQFVQIEEIEGMQFLSAYVPFYNDQGNLLAYLNLPYFARSNDLKNEISNFIVALLNIYALLMVIALVIALILTNRITEPLKLIQEKMSHIQLGSSNEFINYQGKDEIGKLVNEYNKMIAELTESAKRLAETEREDAWREMAKQVAHEIKNPLTPMKLSIQHLQMRWDSFDEIEKSERFESFAKNLIQQIDTLSAIATEFSSFAKLPETSFNEIDISEIIRSSVDIYNGTDDVKVTFNFSEPLIVHGDKDQMLRVFNNLIKNAIQAMPQGRLGRVRVYVEKVEGKKVVVVEDNGKGISKENESRIFVPNFTTKNSGMGLGLAMVQKIIENMSGEIYFESIEGEGTKFIIKLPFENSLS